MKRVLRWHDFGTGREASRSEYREYSQEKRQSHGPKFAPALAGRRRTTPFPGLRPKHALALSEALAIFSIWPASSFSPSPVLASNAHVFHYVRRSEFDTLAPL